MPSNCETETSPPLKRQKMMRGLGINNTNNEEEMNADSVLVSAENDGENLLSIDNTMSVSGVANKEEGTMEEDQLSLSSKRSHVKEQEEEQPPSGEMNHSSLFGLYLNVLRYHHYSSAVNKDMDSKGHHEGRALQELNKFRKTLDKSPSFLCQKLSISSHDDEIKKEEDFKSVMKQHHDFLCDQLGKQEGYCNADVNMSLPLHWIASLGNLDMLNICLKVIDGDNSSLSSAVTTSDDRIGLPIHASAHQGHAACLRALAEIYKEGLATPNKDGRVAIHMSAEEGRVDCIRTILDLVSPTEKKTVASTLNEKSNRNAIHYAAIGGCKECLILLTEAYKEGVSHYADEIDLPHVYAAINGNDECLQLLVDIFPQGASIMDTDGYCPIHYASKYGYVKCMNIICETDKKAIQQKVRVNPKVELMSHGIQHFIDNIHILEDGCENMGFLRMALMDSSDYEVEMMKRPGGDLDQMLQTMMGVGGTECGSSCAHLAASNGGVEYLRNLLEMCKELSSMEDIYGKLPLHNASKNMCAESIDLLLAAHPMGASKKDKAGNLPIHIVFNNSQGNESDNVRKCVNSLLKVYPQGASIKNGDQNLPIHDIVCQDVFDTESLRLLLDTYPQGAATKNKHGDFPIINMMRSHYPGKDFSEEEMKKFQTCLSLLIHNFNKTMPGSTDGSLNKAFGEENEELLGILLKLTSYQQLFSTDQVEIYEDYNNEDYNGDY